MSNESRKRLGRPPLGDEVLKKPITLRLPPQLYDEVKAIVDGRAKDGTDMAQVIREAIVAGLPHIRRGGG